VYCVVGTNARLIYIIIVNVNTQYNLIKRIDRMNLRWNFMGCVRKGNCDLES